MPFPNTVIQCSALINVIRVFATYFETFTVMCFTRVKHTVFVYSGAHLSQTHSICILWCTPKSGTQYLYTLGTPKSDTQFVYSGHTQVRHTVFVYSGAYPSQTHSICILWCIPKSDTQYLYTLVHT